MGKNTVVIDKNELEELKKVTQDLAEEIAGNGCGNSITALGAS